MRWANVHICSWLRSHTRHCCRWEWNPRPLDAVELHIRHKRPIVCFTVCLLVRLSLCSFVHLCLRWSLTPNDSNTGLRGLTTVCYGLKLGNFLIQCRPLSLHRQFQRHSLQCSWTSSLEQSADVSRTAGLVMQPIQFRSVCTFLLHHSDSHECYAVKLRP